MTSGDQKVESAADKLEEIVQEAQRSGGVKAKVAEPFAEDPEFLRNLKPSLVAARIKGESPAEPRPSAPSGPQLQKPKKKTSSGPSPWAVIGGALAAGYTLAKVLDWRGHAHPRV
jgi:hypothetical protein